MNESGLLRATLKVVSVVILISLLIPLSVGWAKGPPSKVVITGPGLADPVEIESPDMLKAFSLFQFEMTDQPAEAPSDPGPGYTITRLMLAEGEYREWDRLVYFPNEKGSGGVVFYVGLVDEDMSTEFDGGWYLVSPEGDEAMREILSQEGVLAESDPTRGQAVMLLGGVGLILGLWVATRWMKPVYGSEVGSSTEAGGEGVGSS